MQLKKKHRRYAIANARKRCWYCGTLLKRATASIDHVVPRARGGSEEPENKVLCCVPCNRQKADMDLETYRDFLYQQRAAGDRVEFFGERLRREMKAERAAEWGVRDNANLQS